MKKDSNTIDMDDARKRMLEETSGVILFGLLIDPSTAENDGLDRRLWETHFPILWCLCTLDSPDNPCPCTGPIVWIPREAVLAASPSNHTSKDGRIIERVVVSHKTELIVDMVSHIPVERFLFEQTTRRPINNDSRFCDNLLIPAPSQTKQEVGILWYDIKLRPEKANGTITGFNEKAKRRSHLDWEISRDNEIRWQISDSSTCVSGSVAVEKSSSGKVKLLGEIEKQSFSIFACEDKQNCLETDGKICLDSHQLALLTQWVRLADPIEGVSKAIQAQSNGSTARSCPGCLLTGGALVLASASCALGNLLGCGGAVLGGIAFGDGCIGACS